MKRITGPILLTVLIGGVLAGIYLSVKDTLFRETIEITGLIGSEKQPFFDDQRVIDRLAEEGIVVNAVKAGSREIATSYDLSQYDFAWPAGVPAAEKMRQEQGISGHYNVFFTPMVIASWEVIAELLVDEGIADDMGGYYSVDLTLLYTLMTSQRRWDELPGNRDYAVNKGILVTTTDVRRSNSAAMYLAMMSYVANGGSIVQNEYQAEAALESVAPLFLRQGYVEYSSAAPFNDYLVMGIGKAPMVNIYEAQFIYAASEGRTTSDMVLIYPEPTVFSKHVFVPLSDNGDRLGELLENDPELRLLAVEHGFRNDETEYFNQFTENAGISLPPAIVNVIETPSYEILEGMIQRIEAQY